MKLNRSLECVLSLLMLIALTPLLILLFIIATIDSHEFGMFCQQRIGKNAKKFTLYKLQTIHPKTQTISSIGKLLRKYKLDELPQLINILNGTMSFVGPRPDIPGYADKLIGADCIILNVRPGVTGLASLKYRNEEYILAQQSNPLAYNDDVIWPDKTRINKWYVTHRSMLMDVQILFYTLVPRPFDVERFIVNWKKKV